VAERLPAGTVARHAGSALALAWRSAPGSVLASVGLAVLGGTAPIALAWLTRAVLDSLAAGAGAVAAPALALAAVGVATALAPHSTRYAAARLERRVGLAAQDRLFTAMNRFAGLARLEDPAFQNRFQLAGRSGGSAPGKVVAGALGVAAAALGVAGFLASLVALSPVVAAVVVVSAVPALLVELALGRQSAALMLRIGHTQRRQLFYARLLSTVDAAKEIRLFGAGDFFRRRMVGELGVANAAQDRVERRRLAVQVVLALFGAVVAGGGLVWLVGQARTGRFTVGDLAMFIAAVAGVQAGLVGGVQYAATTYESLLLFDHFRAVLTAAPDLPVPARPVPLSPLRQGIALRNVWFRYRPDQEWVLRGLDLVIPAGRTVAVVGLNGAGKSTLVKLLCKLYAPTSGRILVDGVDLVRIPAEEWRERLAGAFQDFFRFELLARHAVGLGDVPRLDDDPAVRTAVGRAGADDVVERLGAGLDTQLGPTWPEGVEVSFGQWQKLALARGFMRDQPLLLVLDEPTAALDAMTEHALFERYAAALHHTSGEAAPRRNRGEAAPHRNRRAEAGASNGRISILVSHRFSTVRMADLIVVLDGSRVAEAGSHEQLMARDGTYAQLYQIQAAAYR
jgi:ATP-binding cassette, subfamily B, bacterial